MSAYGKALGNPLRFGAATPALIDVQRRAGRVGRSTVGPAANPVGQPDKRPSASQAPQNHGGTDDDPPRESIGKEPENRCADHVGDEKSVAEQPGLRHGIYVAGCEETGANIRLECGQNLPVDVIEKIDGK